MRIIEVGITGSDGFIGTHITEELKKHANVSVSGFNFPKQNLLKPSHHVRFVKNKDIIIHAAAVSRGDDVDVVSTIVTGTYNLIQAVRQLEKKPKIILLSSVQADKETVYGKSKWLAEEMVKSLSRKCCVPVSIFRIANVFGEGIAPFRHSVIATFSYQLHHDQKLSINTDGAKFHFVYVKDVARQITREVFLERRNLIHQQYIQSRNLYTVSEIAKFLKGFANPQSTRKFSKFEKDLYRTYLSFEKK